MKKWIVVGSMSGLIATVLGWVAYRGIKEEAEKRHFPDYLQIARLFAGIIEKDRQRRKETGQGG